MTMKAPFRPSTIAAALLATLAVWAPPAAAQTGTAAAPISLQLEAQPLAQAIAALSRQSGLRIDVDPALVAGKTAPALNATLPPREALQRLLAGSGLQVVDAGAVLAVRAAPATTAEAPAQKVEVTSSAVRRSTEGSGSFTADSMSTATGLDLSIRETPQSVTIVTQERIEEQNLRTVTQVAQNVTGISVRAYDSARNSFSARGFDIDNFLIDGVPTTYDAGWAAGQSDLDTAIYDRVEVVRGATGLVTGPGNPSAAINLVRKHADSRQFSGTASLELGSWSLYRGDIDLSAPITADGSVRGRFVTAYQSNESYTDFAENKMSVFYGVVDADLTSSTRLSVGASYQDNRPKGTIWGGLPIWYADGTRTDWDVSKTTGTPWTHWSSTVTNYFATLEQRFDNGWSGRATYNRGQYDADMELLFLYGFPDRITGLGMGASPAYYDTSRVQDDFGVFGSGPFTLFERKHELGFGLTYSRQRFNADTRDALSVAPVGDFNRWDGSYPKPPWGSAYAADNYDTTQTAGYAVARFSLADPLKLIVGGRVTNWEQQINPTAWADASTIKHNGVFTPYAGLVYDINPTYSAYASYTDIFQPQLERDRFGNYLDPIEGSNYEAGLKGEFFDGKLNAAVAVFQIRQDNLAQPDGSHMVPGHPLEQAYYAARGATSRGYEFDVSGQLAPGWNLSFGWSQFRAQDADDQDINTNMPRKLLKLFTSYRLPGDWRGLTVGGGVNWESSNYTMATNPAGNLERVEQSSFALVSLMARYEFNPALSLQLNIDNLFDEKFYSQIGFYDQLAYGPPRNVSLLLRYNFP